MKEKGIEREEEEEVCCRSASAARGTLKGQSTFLTIRLFAGHQAKNIILDKFLENQYSNITYRVFIKYCVFAEDFKIFRTLAFLCLPSVSDRVQKSHNI